MPYKMQFLSQQVRKKIRKASKKFINFLSREVSYEKGAEYMKEKDINLFFETSSVDGFNIEVVTKSIKLKAFKETAKMIFMNFIQKKLEEK